MKATYTAELLGNLVRGMFKPKSANWTVGGSECVVEYEGQLYRITVTPMIEEKTA